MSTAIANSTKVPGSGEAKNVLKVLYFDCGCKKHICLAKGTDFAPCSRSCKGCTHAVSLEPCVHHRNTKGAVRSRMVIAREMFH